MDAKELAHLSQLRELHLYNIKAVDLSELARLPVETLVIQNVEKVDLTPLAGNTSLRALHFSGVADMPGLDLLPALQYISLPAETPPAIVRAIGANPSIVRVEIPRELSLEEAYELRKTIEGEGLPEPISLEGE